MAKASQNGQVKVENVQPEAVQNETLSCVYLSYTPCYFSHDGKDYSLINNEQYELPDIPFIQSLIGQGKLVKK